jgi:hypothetical protein
MSQDSSLTQSGPSVRQALTAYMSRADLQRCFAEGVKLMEGTTERDRVRPCADETADDEWIVTLVHYSALSDPFMQDRAQGKAYPTRKDRRTGDD